MKKVFRIIAIIIGIILLDSIQAMIFDNSPIFKIREYYDGGELAYKDIGLLVDTYCGTNGIKDTTIKGFSYSLAYDSNITIIDKSKEIEDLVFAQAEELFYEDENYGYFFGCIKSDYVVVRYSDGTEETVKEALKNNRIEIGYLDKFNIHYIKKEKLHMYE